MLKTIWLYLPPADISYFLEENLPDELVSSNSGWSDQLTGGAGGGNGGGGASGVTTNPTSGPNPGGGPNKPAAQGPGSGTGGVGVGVNVGVGGVVGVGVVPSQMNGAGGGNGSGTGGDDGSGNGSGAGNRISQMQHQQLQHLLQQQQQGQKGAMVVPGMQQLGSKSPNLQSPNQGGMQQVVGTQMGMVNSMPMSISNNGNNGMNAIPGD